MIKRLCLLAAACAAFFALAEAADRAYWRFSAREQAGVFPLYVLGESTAAGEPYGEKLAPGTLAAGWFGGRLAGRQIEVLTVAKPGHSIYPQAVALERRLAGRDRRAPGAVLIYSGHNDAGEKRSPPRYEAARRAATRRSWLLRDLWLLLESRFAPLRLRTLESWEYHLRSVIEASLRAGLAPVLATTPSNAADMDPGVSIDELAPKELAAARGVLERGLALEARRRHRQAIAFYERAYSAAPPAARTYLKYRVARCRQALKEFAPAKELYQEVVDSGGSGNFGRATSAQTERLRALAAEYEIPLADAEKAFTAASENGLLGDSLFTDGHHPNIEGYRLLAKTYALALSKAFETPLAPTAPAEPALTPEERAKALTESGRWLFSVAARQAFPRQRLERAQARFQEAYALMGRDTPAWVGLELTALAERTALLRSTEALDWLTGHDLFFGRDPGVLCADLADFSLRFDDEARAAELERRCLAEAAPRADPPPAAGPGKDAKVPRWRKAARDAYRGLRRSRLAAPIAARLSRDPVLLLDLAQSSMAGDRALARRCVDRARELALGIEERGRAAILYQELGAYAEEIELLDALVGEQPKEPRWLSDRGVARFLLGRKDEAARDWLSAIAADPAFLPAYQSLGVLHSSAGRPQEALAFYRRALAQPGTLHAPSRAGIKEARARLLGRRP